MWVTMKIINEKYLLGGTFKLIEKLASCHSKMLFIDLQTKIQFKSNGKNIKPFTKLSYILLVV